MVISKQQKDCPICGHIRIAKKLYCGQYIIVKCAKCSLYYLLNPKPSESLHESFQADYFDPEAGGRFERLDNEFDSWRTLALQRIAALIRQHVDKPSKLLDVGCATGALFRHFPASSGWQLFGVEPSVAAYRYALEVVGGRPDVQLFHGYLADANYPTGSFDVVCLLEVIYHLPRLVSSMREVSRILKSDGLLLVEVPSFRYLFMHHFGLISQLVYNTKCTLPTSHLYYFSNESMHRLLAGQGFRIENVVPQPTSIRTDWLMRFSSIAFWQSSRLAWWITGGRLMISPRVLYIARRVGPTI